jgi:hypothetical protein
MNRHSEQLSKNNTAAAHGHGKHLNMEMQASS